MTNRMIIAALGCLCLSGCALTGEHVQTVADVLSQQVRDGAMTQAQMDQVLGALRGISSGDWSWLVDVGEALATLVLGYFGIRYWRGPVDRRKGLPPEAN